MPNPHKPTPKRTQLVRLAALAEPGEVVPLGLEFLGTDALTPDERDYAVRVLEPRARRFRERRIITASTP